MLCIQCNSSDTIQVNERWNCKACGFSFSDHDGKLIGKERELVAWAIKSVNENDIYIMDVGAFHGEDTHFMLSVITSLNKVAHVVMVEADKDIFQSLRRKGLPATAVFGAIADHTGECDFYQVKSHGGGHSSIYEPQECLGIDGYTKINSIPCMTMDHLFDLSKFPRIDLLHVDIHGAEKDLIKYGKTALEKTRYMFIEVFDIQYYADMALRKELLHMLGLGWKIIETFPWNLLLQNTKFA